jgi:hypothetical protein
MNTHRDEVRCHLNDADSLVSYTEPIINDLLGTLHTIGGLSSRERRHEEYERALRELARIYERLQKAEASIMLARSEDKPQDGES